MRRSDLLIRAVSVIVFIAIVCYIGYSVYESLSDPLRTVLAVNGTAEDTVVLTGYVVRSETLLPGGGDNVVVTCGEGEKLHVGETVAVRYLSDGSFQRAGEISTLEQQISYIEKLLSGTTDEEDVAWNSVLGLSYSVASGDFNAAGEYADDIGTIVFTDGVDLSEDALNAQLGELESQLDALQAQADSDTEQITTDVSGVYSASTDGLEGVAPSALTDLTPSSLDGLFAVPVMPGEEILGKLVTDVVWYFAAVMDEDDAFTLTQGGTVTMRLSELRDETVSMKVYSLGRVEDGERVVVFTCNKKLGELLSVRSMDVELVFDESAGIRIPAEALHMDEGDEPYIYVLSGLRAKKVMVEVQGVSGSYYLVTSDDTELYEGAEIIVAANGLYDGKVVE